MSVITCAAPPALACRLLAFDTATEMSAMALVAPGQILSIDAAGGAQASTTLLPDLRRLLERAGCRLRDLDAIAFGSGPGAFTGLRTSCSVAQGLAFAAGKPVLPVDSLMLVAEMAHQAMNPSGSTTVWVAQDARMGEIYAAAYRWQGERQDRWQTLVEPALYTIDALNARWREPQWDAAAHSPVLLLTGSALAAMGERLQCPAGMRPIAADAAGSRAQALARLAIALWQDGIRLDAAQAVPLYLRDKVASTTAEREADRAAKAAA